MSSRNLPHPARIDGENPGIPMWFARLLPDAPVDVTAPSPQAIVGVQPFRLLSRALPAQAEACTPTVLCTPGALKEGDEVARHDPGNILAAVASTVEDLGNPGDIGDRIQIAG